MRKWAASAVLAAFVLALLVRVSPLMRFPVWGSDAGEYYRIARDLVASGHVSTAYLGWGVTYPYFPGMFFVVGAIAFGGAELPAALNLAIPALGAFVVVPVFLIAAPRLRDDRPAVFAAALVAVAMPHAYATSHAIPATLGDLLVFTALAMALKARTDPRWLLLFGPTVPALVITHHLSAYFLAVALLLALVLRAMLMPTLPLTALAREVAVFGYVLGSALAFWFVYGGPWRNLIVAEASVQPWWLLFVALGAGLLGVAIAIAARRRRPVRYRPTVPDLRHGTVAYALGLGSMLSVVALGTLVIVPGTAILLSPVVPLMFLPLFVLLAFSATGRKALDLSRDGIDVTGWFLAFVLSAVAGIFVGPRVLVPYRHLEYIVVPLAILAGVGFIGTVDLARPRRGLRAAAIATAAGLLAASAAAAIPPPVVLANWNEGMAPQAFDAPYWARTNIRGGALVAADHRDSTLLFGFGNASATWDTARLTLLAPTFRDAQSEMASVSSPSGARRVEFVLIDADAERGAQLFPWEPAYPLRGEAVAKFSEPPFLKVFDSGFAQVYWVNWGCGAGPCS